MQLWLDTIDTDLIRDAQTMHILTGVTTNPSILSRSPLDPMHTIQKILDIQPGFIAVQTTETELKNIIKQAQAIAKISDRIIIKIPAINDGLRAIPVLEKENIKTLATTIFDTRQIIFSAMLGASYAAPYLSRIETATKNAWSMLREAQHILSTNQYKTQIMGAAIKTTAQFVECAHIGIGAITLPGNVYCELFNSNDSIDTSLEQFKLDWESNPATHQSALFRNHK